mgnify:CR=1 FL=1
MAEVQTFEDLKELGVQESAYVRCSLVAKDSKTLDVYWVDVEGGGGSLIVTPAGESILIDTGMPDGKSYSINIPDRGHSRTFKTRKK